MLKSFINNILPNTNLSISNTNTNPSILNTNTDTVVSNIDTNGLISDTDTNTNTDTNTKPIKLTARLKKLLHLLPFYNFKVEHAGYAAGYSKRTVHSGYLYKKLRLLAKDKGLFEELQGDMTNLIKEDFQLTKMLALQQKRPDLTNFNRSNEALARITGLDRGITAVQVNIDNYTKDADALTKVALNLVKQND